MTAIIVGLLAAVATGIFATFFGDQLNIHTADVVFHVENTVQSMTLNGTGNQAFQRFSQILNLVGDTFYGFGISLIVLVFLIKGFEIYCLWSNGDPEADPCGYTVNFIKAMVVASCFAPIYDFITSVASNLLKTMLDGMHNVMQKDQITTMLDAMKSYNIIQAIVIVIFLIAWVVLFFKFVARGLEMLLLRAFAPVICIGLLENNGGIFGSYVMLIGKVLLTTIVQVLFLQLGLYFIIGGDITIGMIWILGLICMFTAHSAPKLMNEFLIPMGGSSGLSTAHQAVNIISSVKSIVR
jgi:hypothetical protein